MKYGRLPFKEIHFDDHKILIGKSPLNGKLSATIFRYPTSEKNELPIQINWKYRIYNNEKAVFSYVGETKAVLTNDDNEPTIKDIEMLVVNMKLQFDLNWEDKTRNTPLYPSAIPSWYGEPLNNWVQLILKWLQELGH
jgi:hypothetical protein